MDASDFLSLLAQQKWVAILAVILGFAVRILKSDTVLPFSVPARWRVWLAFGLGGAAGALDKLIEAGNTTWTAALTQGLTAAAVAILSHELLIESLRGGRELPIPGLMAGPAPRPRTPPPPPSPPTP